MPDALPRLDRRALARVGGLSALAGTALLASGCDVVDRVLGDDAPDDAGAGGVAATEPARDADTALVDGVATSLLAAAALASAVGDLVTSLAATCADLARLHTAHARQLGRAEVAPAPALGAGRKAARRRLDEAETALREELAAASLAAGSGALAQLFASMAAALTQRRPLATPPSDAGALPTDGDAGADEVAALQVTLAAEHAAVFVVGALGAQTSRTAQPVRSADLVATYRAHLTRRDALVAALPGLGAEPVAAEPGYRLPADLGGDAGASSVARRARRLEDDCAATYAHLVARSTGKRRAWALTALVDAASRTLDFGGSPQTLPGL